jgi:beta-galactosidase GanA
MITALLLLAIPILSLAYDVTFDSKSFTIDGQRKMLIAGSIHYPRASASEWSGILAEAKANGINVIQTYVFWSIHEPEQGKYYFPSDGSNADLVAFTQECQKQGFYVNMRFGPYTCAEWNYGGFPAWLKDVNNITFRTMSDPWLHAMGDFVTAAVKVLDDAKLFAKDGGPIIMAQIENEYGNMESNYGADGAKYVQWSVDLAESFKIGVPWIMCQQGEGNGSNPPEYVVNTCNGYYCDSWITSHTKAFPNQPVSYLLILFSVVV